LKTAGLSSPLTSAEKRVLAALADGSAADVHFRGARQPIRSGLIRAIAIGLAVPVDEVDPRGLHVVGAVFAERIELDDVRFPRPLRLVDCELEAGLSAERAELHLLELERCTIGAPDSVEAGDFDDGAGDPDDAGGGSHDVAALMLDELRVTHGVSFVRSEVTGAVHLLGANIGGQLNCDGGTFTNDTGPALSADGLTTNSDVSLSGTFTGHSTHGTVRLLGATIGGQLDFSGGTFTNTTGPALDADRLTTTSTVFLGGTFTGHSTHGTVRLLGAFIGSELHCTEGTFTNDTGPALHANGLTTTSHVYLDGIFTGHGELGAIRLLGATIGGQLHCTDGTFTNKTGPALDADGLTTTSDLLLRGTFTGHSTDGAIRLLGATIGGELQCTDGTFTNDIGPALNADGLTTTSNVFLGGTFTGHGELGAIRLLGATIGGQLHCLGGLLRSKTPDALSSTGPGCTPPGSLTQHSEAPTRPKRGST
jgi:hypothetical protein